MVSEVVRKSALLQNLAAVLALGFCKCADERGWTHFFLSLILLLII